MGLLSRGNLKVGDSVWVWSIPPITTCPGSTDACRAVCYATEGHYAFEATKARLEANLALARSPAFGRLIAREIQRRFIPLVRIHAAGDFFSAAYVRSWTRVVDACPDTRFWYYTRSWRLEEMRGPLAELGARPHVSAWWSIDRDTDVPENVPAGTRLAFLQADAGDYPPPEADLVFRTRALRKEPRRAVGLTLVCRSETGQEGPKPTCGRCGFCFRKPR